MLYNMLEMTYYMYMCYAVQCHHSPPTACLQLFLPFGVHLFPVFVQCAGMTVLISTQLAHKLPHLCVGGQMPQKMRLATQLLPTSLHSQVFFTLCSLLFLCIVLRCLVMLEWLLNAH